MSINVLSWRGRPVLDNGQWYIDLVLEIDSAGTFGTVLETSVNRMHTGTALTLEPGIHEYTVRADCGDVELWQANTTGIAHVYPLQLRLGDWSDSRLYAFFIYSVVDGKPYVNGNYLRIRGTASRISKGMHYESLLRYAELSGLNAVLLNGTEGHSFKEACLRVGLLPLTADQVPPSVKHINAIPCREGDYLAELKQYFDICDGIMKVRSTAGSNSGYIIHSLNDRAEDGVEDGGMTLHGKWKLMQYGIRRFSAPLTPFCIQKDDRIYAYVANDTSSEQKAEVAIKLRDFSGRKVEDYEHAVTVPAHSTSLINTIKVKYPFDQVFCYIRLSTKDTLRERTHLLTSQSKAKLQAPQIKAECKQISAGAISIKLTAEHPAFYVALSSGSIKGIFSDNMIAVRPSAAKSVIFQSMEQVKLEDFEKELKVFDLYSGIKCN